MIGAIILAAGSSRRFGDDKRRSVLPSGLILLEESIRKAASVIDEVIVVLRFGDKEFAEELEQRIKGDGIKYYCAPDSAKGMGHSLANSISRVEDWDAALVFLGDMPFVQAETIEFLLAEYKFRKKHVAPIVIPIRHGRRGHPVLFANEYFEEIAAIEGDNGAKIVIDAHPAQVFAVEVEDFGVIRDIDTPEDLAT